MTISPSDPRVILSVSQLAAAQVMLVKGRSAGKTMTQADAVLGGTGELHDRLPGDFKLATPAEPYTGNRKSRRKQAARARKRGGK